MDRFKVEKLPTHNLIILAGDMFREVEFTPAEIESAVRVGASHLYNKTSVIPSGKVLCLFFLKGHSFNNLLESPNSWISTPFQQLSGILSKLQNTPKAAVRLPQSQIASGPVGVSHFTRSKNGHLQWPETAQFTSRSSDFLLREGIRNILRFDQPCWLQRSRLQGR